ncbi:ureidoglycolate lyase [Granulosicoccaceae sp. 1_MG-2023]|nr:ureidoglycolate lyase [Granulosicoccaceae sp. 1_MG-2023]
MRLPVEALTAEAFRPFGDVISTEGRDWFSINNGSTQRFHDLAQVTVGDGRALISIFRATPLALPLRIALMEQHPLGSQTFVPLSPRPFLVVVAPPGDYDNDALRCFITRPGEGVNYHPGVWHHPVIALQGESDFLVVDRGGEGNNCIEITVDEACQHSVAT